MRQFLFGKRERALRQEKIISQLLAGLRILALRDKASANNCEMICPNERFSFFWRDLSSLKIGASISTVVLAMMQ